MELINSLKEIDKFIEDNDIESLKIFDLNSGKWQYILAIENLTNEAMNIVFNKNFMIKKCQLVPNNRNSFEEIILNYKFDSSKYSTYKHGINKYSKDKAIHSNLKPFLEV